MSGSAKGNSLSNLFHRNFSLQSGLAHPKNDRQECLMNSLVSSTCARRLFMALAAISGIFLTASCGNSSGLIPPNNNGFSASSLSGTYVISISGTDVNQTTESFFAIVGTITADGNGNLTGGTVDINDANLGGSGVFP